MPWGVKRNSKIIQKTTFQRTGAIEEHRKMRNYLRRMEREGVQRVKMFLVITAAYVLFWGPLFFVTLVHHPVIGNPTGYEVIRTYRTPGRDNRGICICVRINVTSAKFRRDRYIYVPINIPRSLLISPSAFVRTCDAPSANINSAIYRMPAARPRIEFRPGKKKRQLCVTLLIHPQMSSLINFEGYVRQK